MEVKGKGKGKGKEKKRKETKRKERKKKANCKSPAFASLQVNTPAFLVLSYICIYIYISMDGQSRVIKIYKNEK